MAKGSLSYSLISLHLVNAVDSQVDAQVVEEYFEDREEPIEAKLGIYQVLGPALIEGAQLCPPILGSRAYHRENKPKDDQEDLGHLVELQPREVIFARLLQDTIQAVVEAEVGSAWPNENIEKAVGELPASDELAVVAHLNNIVDEVNDLDDEDNIGRKPHPLDDSQRRLLDPISLIVI
eukprot:CAMPEP_0168610890 /NCGR_PEP_ID=MMETSP0449_2-20121227/2045_1 /TAXON_ID=1082188 /ORGANISM="Strombidium rassoulzadegani, Strain ras09" /LENGTH=178 /DNA_ID=CAMNT_0008651259 /DNA_START=165 /DNA_END=700 /DNA_ORIENTATION=+